MQKPFFALVNGVYNEKALLLAVAEESGLFLTSIFQEES